MAQATFVIPEKDADRVEELGRHLRAVVGLKQVRIAHQPFDPFGPDAEAEPIAESRVTVAYDPAETTIAQIAAAFKALHIHVLHVYADG